MPILRRARAKGADADDVAFRYSSGHARSPDPEGRAPGPHHGYAVAQRLQQISRDVVQVQQGRLYPALHRLENARPPDRVEAIGHGAGGEVLPAHPAGEGAA